MIPQGPKQNPLPDNDLRKHPPAVSPPASPSEPETSPKPDTNALLEALKALPLDERAKLLAAMLDNTE